jgi:hypothetical protein
MTSMTSWNEQQQSILRLAQRQLFFVGGAPRSGTTWMQLLLDSHPQVSCRGEGLFNKYLAPPIDALLAAWRQGVDEKNRKLFGDLGYPLPQPQDSDFLLATAVLHALDRQRAGKDCRAIGEKNPENVFFFPRLKQLFASAKFIGIARDPRDGIASAWHFFRAPTGVEGDAVKIAYIHECLPSIQQGMRTLLGLREAHPADCLIVTYERLNAAPEAVARELFRFLGVTDDAQVVRSCVARTSFRTLSGGRPAGVAQQGAFFRKGVVGDWRSAFTPEMGELIVAELGWSFPHFGWQR